MVLRREISSAVGPKVACVSIREACSGVGWTTSDVVSTLLPHEASNNANNAIEKPFSVDRMDIFMTKSPSEKYLSFHFYIEGQARRQRWQ